MAPELTQHGWPPAPWRLPHLSAPALAASAVLGFALALLIVLYPLPGMAAPAVVGALLLFSRQPQWLMLAFFTSLAIPIQRSVGGLPLNAADALLVLWCLLWPLMMQRAASPSRAEWRVPTTVLFIAPFIVAVLIAQLGSINPGSSLKQALRVVEWFVVLPLAITVFSPDARFRRFAGVMLMLVPCVFAIDGMFEYLNNGRTLTGMVGISVPVPEGSENQIRHTYDVSGRAGSSFGGAQGLAMYLVMTMGFAIAHIAHPPAPWMRRLGLVCLLISIGGLVVAKSRGGLIGGVALLVAMALVARPRLRLPFVLAVLFSLSVALVGLGLWPGWDGTLGGLVPGRPEAVLDRLIIWGRVREVMTENPFFGVGLGNFRDAFFAREAWLHVDLAYPSLHAHNTYLEILADTGWVGLCSYLFFLLATATTLVRRWTDPATRSVLTLAAIGTLAAYTVFAMVDMLLLQNMHLLLVLVLNIGLLGSAGAAADKGGA